VTDTLGPVTDVVDPVVPVTETVDEVEKTAGTTDATTSGPKTRTPKTTKTDGDTTTQRSDRTTPRHRGDRVDIKELMSVPPKNYASWPGPVADMPGLRSAWTDAAPDVTAPAVAAPAAPARDVISLAGGTLRDLGDAGTPAGRTLLVIISTLTIGALAGGHVKFAQDRMLVRTV
jgi:hypothetical protein